MEVVGRACICQLYDLECCLGSHTLKWSVGVVFIATNHLVAVGEGCWRWAHRTLSGAPPRHPTVRVRSWSTVGGFVLMWHRIVRCRTGLVLFTVRCTSDSAAPCSSRQVLLQSTVARSIRCSADTPDSPVIFSGVRLLKPESGLLDSVRSWCTGHCPVAHRTVRCARPEHT
jgi:hypothetical protein